MNNKIIKPQSQRLAEIDNLVDQLIPNDYINELIKKYKVELDGYKYISTVEAFSILPAKGSLRYIKKYSKELRFGGLLIKILKKNNKWYGIVKKMDGKKYFVSFDSNYIFYHEQQNTFNQNLSMFISDVDKGMYEII